MQTISSPLGPRPGKSLLLAGCRAALALAALAAAPVHAGIQYGRDDWSSATATPVTVCTDICSPSQTCSPLFPDDPNSTAEYDLCLNKSYPLVFMGKWQQFGRKHHVGEVVTDPATGAAYIFVDVSVPSLVSNFFTEHPPLTDPLSWQPFTGLTTSATGATGDTGPQGPQGLPGATGPAGPAGAAGPIGPIGPIGLTGPAGPAGAQGLQGPDGLPGAVGPVGPAGPIGPVGPMGSTGPIGPAGATGAPGATGATGSPGPQGLMGFTGATGSTGPTGAQGPAGPTGSTGLPGAPGPQGPAGPTQAGSAVLTLLSGPRAVPPAAPAGYALLGTFAFGKSTGVINWFAIYAKLP